MGIKKFSSKEAIAHGWDMTKKYWKTILLVAVVYMMFYIGNGILENFAGSRNVDRSDIEYVLKDPQQAKLCQQFMFQDGLIDKYGRVLKKLREVSSASELNLPPDLEPKRLEIFDLLSKYRYRLPFPIGIYYFLCIVLWVIGMVMSIGYTKINLMLSRDENPSVEELFLNWDLFIPYILSSICYGLVVIGGMILLIVPGIIFAVMLQMYFYLIVDKGLGPIQSLKRSRVITKGSRGQLCVFGLLLFLLNLAGLLCLVVGLFFTISISSIAMAYVYDRLEHSSDVTPVQAANTGS